MSRGTLAMKAVLRKDFLVLWPLIAIVVVLVGLRNLLLPELAQAGSQLRPLVEVAASFACCVLLVALIQQDSLVSDRHDWLTRPIPRGSLFAAKLILITGTILIPADLSLMAASLASGSSFAESSLEGAQFSLVWFGPLLMLAAIAAVTNSLLQAAGAFVSAVILAMLIVPISMHIGGASEAIYGLGVGWVATWSYMTLLVLASVAVLWIQYTRRSTRLARTIVVVTAVAATLAPAVLSWRFVFGVQQMFSAPEQAAHLETRLAPGCFPTLGGGPPIAVPGQPGVDVESSTGDWTNFWLAAGADAIGFSTTLNEKVPAGWRTSIGNAALRYENSQGERLVTLRLARYPADRKMNADGTTSHTHVWLLPLQTYNKLRATDTHVVLTYSLSLLEPVASTTLEVGGERKYTAGMGYCGARLSRNNGAVVADCLKRGPQAALLRATMNDDQPEASRDTSDLDYTPAALRLLSVERRSLDLTRKPNMPANEVTITAYSARAHVDREFTVPGVLGGEQCEK